MTLWNPLAELFGTIARRGGFVNAHAHFDRAYSVLPGDFGLFGGDIAGNIDASLQEKWRLVDAFKAHASEEIYHAHITAALKQQKEFGVNVSLSFIDCDAVAGDRALRAAVRASRWAAQELGMKFLLACQTLKGVLDPDARTWFEKAVESVDIVGGLPGADKGREGEHLDVILAAAKNAGKRLHVHVDQLNSPNERETELLARKTIAWGMEGRVTAVHAISLAAQSQEYRNEIYRLCRDAGLSFVACPTAWIDARRSEVLTPTHNAVTAIDEMIPAGLTVAIGSDNVADVYKPFSDGDMRVELRVLFEAAHYYRSDELVQVATNNGLRVLGLLD